MIKTYSSSVQPRVCSIIIYLAVFCVVSLSSVAYLLGRTEREDEAMMILSVSNRSFYVDKREAKVESKRILVKQFTPTPSVLPSTQRFRNPIPSTDVHPTSPTASVRTKPTENPNVKHVHHLPTFDRSCKFKTFAESSNVHIRKFVGNEERSYSHVPYPARTGSFSFTLVFVTTVNRLPYVDEHLWRWSGSMTVVVYSHLSEEPIVLDYICHRQLPSRLTLIVYVVPDNYPIFPINKLRNIGIRSVNTTHYIVMDMDVWPIRSFYEEMKKLPSHVLSNPKSAIIVPLLFFKLDQVLPNCESYDSCIDLDLQLYPESLSELNRCLNRSVCTFNRGKLKTHSYTNLDWLHYAMNSNSSPLLRINCMLNSHQEPYYFLMRHPSTPLFDERYINYGYNKMEHMDKIRAQNYKFYLVTHAFAMDMAHQESAFGENFNKKKSLMIEYIYKTSKKLLEERYGPQQFKGVCKTKEELSHCNSPVSCVCL